MTREATPPILSELQNPESTVSQTAALRALKNEVVGHAQRKEVWIGWGIVPVLSRILCSRRGNGKQSIARGLNGESRGTDGKRGHTEEDGACLQAIIIVGSLAQGGPAFVAPILAGNVLQPLLSILSAADSSPALALSVLKTLNTIADRLPHERQRDWPRDKQLADLLYSEENVGTLARILSQSSPDKTVQSMISLAAALISKTCTDAWHKITLAEAGVLDALAFRLASFVVAQGYVLPGAESHLLEAGTFGSLAPSAPSGAQLAPVLRAIAIIIEHSKTRAEHFLSSPAILAVFPKQTAEFSPSDIKRGPWGSNYFSGFAVPRFNPSNPIDSLLPSVPVAQPKNAANFPPLGAQTSYPKQGQFFNVPTSFFETGSADEDESAVISWLICVLREESGIIRLMAAKVVTILFHLGLAKKHRTSMFGYLVLPLLIRMFDKDYEFPEEPEIADDGIIPVKLRVREEAPGILAALVMDNMELQRHAVDGGAIQKLSQLLKESYNPLTDDGKPMWNADAESVLSPRQEGQADRTLGQPGYPPIVSHTMRFREGILRALAALAPFKDDYRKAICDNGVVPYIIDSLKPCDPDGPIFTAGGKNVKIEGNPTPTLLAACSATRTLTRSVSILRTSLIDAGVAPPLFELVKHRDVEVQIAATSVICNLALDFSPMKDAIISAGMLPTLCEHAHSSNSKLRLESIWALKHVAYNSTNDIKMKIIQDLGPGWLKQILCREAGEPSSKRTTDVDMESSMSFAMGTSNSAGEKVDLLNPVPDTVAGESRESQEDLRMIDTATPQKNVLDLLVPDTSRRRKLALNGDLDSTKQARRADIAVQEQALDLLRNLICGTGATEMIDFVFKELGEDELLHILAEKLRPRNLGMPSRRDASTLPIPTEILTSVTYVLIHFAAGLPRHRQLIVTHPELMKLMMPLFTHSSPNVRVNCTWVVINLTYEDDQSDRAGCRERAHKLRSLGILDQLGKILNDDELDVRERAKTAMHLTTSLLGSQ